MDSVLNQIVFLEKRGEEFDFKNFSSRKGEYRGVYGGSETKEWF
jgi:hypothetical protein